MIKKATEIKIDKSLSNAKPLIKATVPEFLFLAKENARCNKAEIFIKEGDHVNIGQTIGMRHAAYFDQPIQASCSGTYVGLEKHYHRNGKLTNFLKIQNDFQDTFDESIHERSDEEIAAMSREDMSQIIKDCACVGLGGSSFPTYVKFNTDKEIKTILINAVECEPYIVSDKTLMLDDFEEIIKGARLLKQAFNCSDIRNCFKKKHKDLNEVCNSKLQEIGETDVQLCQVKNFYPQGWEIALIKSATGIEVESGKLPAEYGVLVFNVSTLWGIYKAVKYNLPVYERYVNVSGSGINIPTAFKVRIGTPVSCLIEQCGGYKGEEDKTIVLGGPMMGANIPSDDCIITKTVTSVIVSNHKEYKEEPCVRCGSCVLSCPAHLQPVTIMNAMRSMPVDKEKIKQLEPLKCIECGLCSYVCTSKIPVTDYVKRAKVVAKLK